MSWEFINTVIKCCCFYFTLSGASPTDRTRWLRNICFVNNWLSATIVSGFIDRNSPEWKIVLPSTWLEISTNLNKNTFVQALRGLIAALCTSTEIVLLLRRSTHICGAVTEHFCAKIYARLQSCSGLQRIQVVLNKLTRVGCHKSDSQ